jgi:head-tail adaptor
MTDELAGALRERVSIERRLADRDIWAGARGRWVYDGSAWVAVSPLAPGDPDAADALTALPRWRITMRKREGIGPQTRLVWRGRFLAVRSLISDPREPAQMVLSCEEQR